MSVFGNRREREAHEALESDRRFRALLSHARIAIFVLDVHGAVLDVNDAAVRMLGYGREELATLAPTSVLGSEADVIKAYQYGRGLLQGGVPGEPLLFRVRRKDGRALWVEVECSPLRRENGEIYALVGTAVDTTRAVRARRREARLAGLLASVRDMNRQLRELHSRLEHVVSGDELGEWDWSISADHVDCGARCKRTLGYAPDELGPSLESWRELVHPDDRERVNETLRSLVGGAAESFELEQRLRHKAGYWVWVLCRGRVVERAPSGRPVRVCGTLFDISERKRHEEELLLSRERYETYVRLTTDGIYRFELDEPIPTSLPVERQIELAFDRAYLAEANDAYARMYGYSRGGELVGKRLVELFGGRDNPINRPHLRQLIENGYRVENTLSRELDREGKERYFRNTMFALVESGAATRVWGTQHDVTELIQAQKALQDSEERFRRLAETIRIIPWESDIATEAFTYVGPRAIEILGYPADAWLERGFWEQHIAPQDRDAAIDMCKRRIEEGATDYSLEYRLIAADGRPVWVLDIAKVVRDDGRPVRLRGFLIEITHQKKTQESLERYAEELAQQRRLTQKVFDTNPNALYVFDLDRGDVVLRNRHVAQLMGYTMAHIKALMPNVSSTLMHPDDYRRFREYIRSMRHVAEDEVRSFEYRMRAADGSWRWFLSWDTPFERSEDGSVKQIIGTAMDITDLKNAQADLERYQHRLEMQNQQLSRMNRSLEEANRRLRELDRTKSDFVSVASHELRTPVTSILAFTQILLSTAETVTPRNRHTYLKTIEREARRLGVLAADLLDISRIESGRSELHLESVSLPEIAGEVVEGLSVPPDRSVSLESDEAGARPIICDPGRIRQVLSNLIENAVRYGTEIRIAISGNAGERRVDVIDNGPGIAPQDIGRIFTKFYRVRSDKAPGKGSGLGLAIARDIVKAHGGRIWVDSTVGKGSAFHFTLKAPPAEQGHTAAPGRTSIHAP